VYCVVFVSEFVGEFVFVQACGCTAVQDNATPQSKYTIFSCTDRVSCDGEKERRKEKPREVGGESAGEGGREGGGRERASERERERERKIDRERERERERGRNRARERRDLQLPHENRHHKVE